MRRETPLGQSINADRNPSRTVRQLPVRHQPSGHGQDATRLALLSDRTRTLRFLITGAVAGGTQILLLAALTWWGTGEIFANILAFLLAAQLNFMLSQSFTWRDRRRDSLPRRWVLFHASIGGSAFLNLGVYAVASRFMPALPAATLGIAAASAVNFVAHDRLTFRGQAIEPEAEPDMRAAA